MNTEELRANIWDEIFAKGTMSINDIAAFTEQDGIAVRAAVDHNWFTVNGDQVSIAMAAPEPRGHQPVLR